MSILTKRLRWLQLGKSLTQTGNSGGDGTGPITAGNPVQFDVINGNLPYTPATSSWTLFRGKIYRIDVTAGGQFSGAGGVLDLDLYDVTNAVALSTNNIATRVQVLPWTAASNVKRGPSSTSTIFKVGSASVQMQLRIITATSLTGIYRTVQGTSLTVQELG
jgi:hypothetical protein